MTGNFGLDPGEVHVWHAPVAVDEPTLSGHLSVLSEEECLRAKRFLFGEDRRRFVTARGTLRLILSAYTRQRPSALELRTTELGKPFLRHGGPQFSISHSGDWVAIGVAPRPIGVDIEKVRYLSDLHELARRFFSPLEVSRLQQENTLDVQAFYRCWTRKEAYLKARGEGLSVPPALFSVSIEHNNPRLLLEGGHRPKEGLWRIADLDVAAGYCGALAAQGGFDSLIERNWKATVLESTQL